ncbi:YciI family protein [Vallitalea okinawensis]|uniref:YciI family protein n=1 Tax=Vallitalea okinawensis TaxID=2078660 RepID=UPI000CFDD175|nr:YciI family protein [Vallitalea okinawensis]
MSKGEIYYIRTDNKVEGKKVERSDYDAHIRYLEGVAKSRYFKGGGFKNKDGGMIIFKADSMEEAKLICDGDPLINRKLYTYELVEWEIVIG